MELGLGVLPKSVYCQKVEMGRFIPPRVGWVGVFVCVFTRINIVAISQKVVFSVSQYFEHRSAELSAVILKNVMLFVVVKVFIIQIVLFEL